MSKQFKYIMCLRSGSGCAILSNTVSSHGEVDIIDEKGYHRSNFINTFGTGSRVASCERTREEGSWY